MAILSKMILQKVSHPPGNFVGSGDWNQSSITSHPEIPALRCTSRPYSKFYHFKKKTKWYWLFPDISDMKSGLWTVLRTRAFKVYQTIWKPSNVNPWWINPSWLMVVVVPNNSNWPLKWYLHHKKNSLGFINQGLTLLMKTKWQVYPRPTWHGIPCACLCKQAPRLVEHE